VVAGAVQLLGNVGVMMIVGKVGVITVTTVVTLVVLPDASVAEALTSNVPGFWKTCATTAFPVTAIVNVAGMPAFGAVVGGVMTIVGAAAIFTVTVAVA
jgi:hypothetical protein